MWQVEHFRATAFFLSGAGPDPQQGWWEAVVGTPPDEERRRPQQGSVQQFGRLGGNALAVEWRPERVDWRLVPPGGSPNQSPAGFPVLGRFSETFDPFLELSCKGLERCGAISRLAIGLVLLIPVGGIKDAYSVLQRYLPSVKLDIDGPVDFLYQINRPRMSASMDEVAVNRLTKWSVSMSGSIAISLTPGSGIMVPDPNPRFASRLELDINTAPSGSLIPTDKVIPLFRELAQLGAEIAREGDVP